MVRRKTDSKNWGGNRRGSGRPPGQDSKTKSVMIRLSELEYNKIKKLSKKNKLPLSTFIRELVLEKIIKL
ncbi:MAG: hypothetical protein GY870_16925 [archaeon]|nr:hypothetical protein [archaeon]